jgi:hypothetical protein
MEDTYNPAYREQFYEGYTVGLNPAKIVSANLSSEAFTSGFQSGRREYERLNGRITSGIPKRIVTKRVLEEFMLAGMLGMDTDSEHYTPYQMEILLKWYQSGIEKYDPEHSSYLIWVLESKGIGVR